jgi:uncharacterized protein
MSRKPDARPGPVDHQSPSNEYQEGLKNGLLLLQRCDSCAATVFPPRVFCPKCGTSGLTSFTSDGRGRIYSSTEIPRRDSAAHTVVLVDLDDGVRIMGSLRDGDASQIGSVVAMKIAAIEGGHRLEFFKEDMA